MLSQNDIHFRKHRMHFRASGLRHRMTICAGLFRKIPVYTCCKQWKTLFLLGSKITIDSECNHEIKRRLLLGRKAMASLDSTLKSRDITLLTKVRRVEAMVFPVVVYGCESWTIKKVKHQRIDSFELWRWRRLLRIPWTATRANQSILKDWCWRWSSNTLATWCEELTHWKRPWYWERQKAGGDGDDKGRDGWMASWTQWAGVWAGSGRWWRTGKPGVPRSMGSQRVRHDWATEQYLLMRHDRRVLAFTFKSVPFWTMKCTVISLRHNQCHWHKSSCTRFRANLLFI